MISHRRCHTLLFWFLLIMDLADFITDWLFYVDVKLAAEGLVYGPVEPVVVKLLLAFSIIGTVTFLVEMINLYLEMWRDKNLVDSDFLSAFVTWVEDVPQIAISLHIALCREEAISIFQLTKAAVVLTAVFVRIIICCVKYCNPKAIRSHHHVWYKAFIFIGVILESSCAGAIFFLTNTEKTEDGSVNFKVPQTLIRDEFNEQRYFAGAAVFVHQRDLFDIGRLDDDHSDLTVNWLRLVAIDDIRGKKILHVKYDYQMKSKDSFNMAVWLKGNGQNSAWSLSGCYTINSQRGSVHEQQHSTCTSTGFLNKPTSVIFTFQFEPPNTLFKKRVFGHLTFNAKVQTGNSCREVQKVSDKIEDETKLNASLTVHFYLTGSNISYDDAKHFNHHIPSSIVFYRNDGVTLADVEEVWKTGWRKCSMTGYGGPPLDSNLDVPC